MLKRYVLCIALSIIFAIPGLALSDEPPYNGTFQFNRNFNPISIKRDGYGIPTIESKTFKDTYYGLGFAHAQDRLWAAHFKKWSLAGRLSEILGEDSLPLDKLMRSISLHRYSKYALETIPKEIIEELQAYCDGFNDAVSTMKTLPLEFWVTGSKPEPLEVIDAVLSVKALSFFLSFGYVFEILFTKLEPLIGREKLIEIFPIESEHYLWGNVTIMSDEDLMQTGIYEKLDLSKNLTSPPGQQFPEERRPPHVTPGSGSPNPGSQGDCKVKKPSHPEEKTIDEKIKGKRQSLRPGSGSNAWVIDGRYTTTGKPIVANDPHQTNSIPSAWYNAALITEDGFVSGMSGPGFPYIAIGKSDHISWALTASLLDVGDLYNITRKGDKYYYEGHWIDLKKFNEKIYIKGQKAPVEFTVYETHQGVILDPYFIAYYDPISYISAPGETYALAWMGYTKVDQSIMAVRNMPTAKTAQEMIDVWGVPSSVYMNLHFATTSGDIGFLVLGRIPIRSPSSSSVRVKDGSRKDQNWLGWVPWEDQPRVINPEKGYIVSANNKIATDNLKWRVSLRTLPTSRAVRIEEMISEFIDNGQKISVEDIQKMQLDVLDVFSRKISPIMTGLVRKALDLGYQTTIIDQDKLEKMLDELEGWDYRMEKESIAASIQSAWELLFKNETFLGLDIQENPRQSFIKDRIYENFFGRKMLSWASFNTTLFYDYWCQNEDNRGQPNPCLYTLVKSLEETWVFLEKTLGEDYSNWQWQNLHREKYPNSLWEGTAFQQVYERLVPNSGNERTVKASIREKGGDFTGVWSPNMRMVMNVDPNEDSYAIIDTGISESPLSEHYDDQMKAYYEGKWLKMQVEPLVEWKDKTELIFAC